MMEIKQFTVNFFGENCYLLYDETKEAVLIDCGCMNRQEFSQVEGFITQQQLVLKHHLCTHYHVDHLMGAALVYQQYGLLPEVCREDTVVLPPVGQQAVMFGLPNIQETAIGTYLNEGDAIHFGHTKLEVIAVPGHSPGSVAFYQKERGCVFVGDALFAGSIGRTDLSVLSIRHYLPCLIRRLFIQDTVLKQPLLTRNLIILIYKNIIYGYN